ncbi:MAG: transposase [Planctomycetaceae bacterium]|nr:transposase [Planctomycetaceae bacterium]
MRLTYDHAKTLVDQWQITATIHEWRILAAAVMSNHFHLVVGAAETHHGSDLLRDFKSFGSRRLTEAFGRPRSGTWWTSSGSRRHLANGERVAAAVRYVLEQEFPLIVWRDETL